MPDPDQVSTSVLIVGAGPTGLALAIELGHRRIPCIVLERNDRVGYAPRAKTTNVRTREHMRRWGIADALRAASPLGVYYPSNIVFVTRLAGFELARFENCMYCQPGKNPLYSEHGQWIPQYTVEQVMRRHAQSMPDVDVRFCNDLLSFEQTDEGVQAKVRSIDDDFTYTVNCRYLVGADGGRSKVRESIGGAMEGQYGLSRNYNVVFRAPGLAEAHSHGPAIMYWQVNSDVPNIVGPMDRGDRWFFMPTSVPDGFRFQPAEAPDLIRRSTGIDLPYEVLSSDEWAASRLLSTRYRDRRVFIAGDACHLNPPFGGYGMNMGVADGVDLGWKLAARLQGWGGATLLDSYETERRQVHNEVLDEAASNHSVQSKHLQLSGMDGDSVHGHAIRAGIGELITAQKMKEFNSLGVVKGYRYADSPVIVDDGKPPRVGDTVNYLPSAKPGSVAPHAWLGDGSSLYDHFGQGLTLLVTQSVDQDQLDSIRGDAEQTGVPLKIFVPRERALASLYEARFALVRPDQHVAWRGNEWPGSSVLRRVTGGSPA